MGAFFLLPHVWTSVLKSSDLAWPPLWTRSCLLADRSPFCPAVLGFAVLTLHPKPLLHQRPNRGLECVWTRIIQGAEAQSRFLPCTLSSRINMTLPFPNLVEPIEKRKQSHHMAHCLPLQVSQRTLPTTSHRVILAFPSLSVSLVSNCVSWGIIYGPEAEEKELMIWPSPGPWRQ